MDWKKWEAQKVLQWSQRKLRHPSLLYIHCHQFCLHIYWDCIFSLAFLFWLMHLENPHLLFFTSLAKSHCICALALLSHLQIWTRSLHLSRPHVSASTFLFLSLRSRPFSSDLTCFQSVFLDFLNTTIEDSCALRKVSLKSCQLLSSALSLTIICQGISPTSSSSWNSTFPKFRVLTLL